MINENNSNKDNAETVIEATKDGAFKRSLAWANRNKWKIAGGIIATVGAGVGIYYLTKDDSAADAVVDAVVEAATATTEAAA